MKSIYSQKKNIDNFNRLKRMLKTLQESNVAYQSARLKQILKTLQESKHVEQKRKEEIKLKLLDYANGMLESFKGGERQAAHFAKIEDSIINEILELEARLQTANDTNKILHNTNEMLLKEIPAIKTALLKIAETLQVLALVIVPQEGKKT